MLNWLIAAGSSSVACTNRNRSPLTSPPCASSSPSMPLADLIIATYVPISQTVFS